MLFSELEPDTEPVGDGISSFTRGTERESEPEIVDTQTESSATKKTIFRTSLVKLMKMSLLCWQQSTGKNKIDLAEESKLWRVNVDEGQLRVRTLDRYLRIDKLPMMPRTPKVLKTAYFVLDKSNAEFPLRENLKIALNNILRMTYELPF